MQWDGSFLQVNSTGAEYTDKSLKEAVERNEVIKKIPGVLDQAFKKGRTSCLVFVRAVEEARELASITPFSAYLHAETEKKERAQIIKAFKSGSIKTVYNVGILTTGFDYPELDTIILARPTMSLALYVQMIGRGIRIAEGKEHVSVLDMCGNLKRFGKIEELIIENDEQEGWVLRNDKQILSGRRLDELV
jgi:DNA repair protein RadD